VHERQIDLEVGQSVWVGAVLVTIVDIDDDEVHVRLDDADDLDADDLVDAEHRGMILSLPR